MLFVTGWGKYTTALMEKRKPIARQGLWRAQGKQREIEVKLAVADVSAARRAIAALGASASGGGRVHEMNTIYDTPNDTLRKRGHLLRLRVIRTERGRPARKLAGRRWGVLTHKGPSLREPQARGAAPRGSRYKERIESEVLVASARIAGQERMLRAAGFAPAFRYEKHRTSFRLPERIKWARKLMIELDETPAGAFLELEGPRRAIDRAARLLGYSMADYITRSYVALWSEHCRRGGLPWGDMLFGRTKPGAIRQKK